MRADDEGMNKRMLVSAAIVVGLVVTSCGDDSSSTDAGGFSDQLAGICRPFGRGIGYFLLGTSNVVLWALSPTADLLVPALQAWGESISQ